jgi:outer membrane protein assembly factor BamB
MLKRALTSILLAGLISFAFPMAASQAAVSGEPDLKAPDFNGRVYTIAHKRNTVFVGGKFTRVSGPNGTFKRRGAAAFDLRTGKILKWNPRVKGTVRSLAVRREGVYLAGTFGKVGKQNRRNLARVSAKGKGKVQKLKINIVGQIHSVDVGRHSVYLGGDFTKINNKRRARLAAVSRKTGKLTKWRPKVDRVVFDLDYTKAGVYAAGRFMRVNGSTDSPWLTLLNGKGRGGRVTTFNSKVQRQVIDLVVTKSRVYVAEAGNHGGGLAAVDRRNGRKLWEERMDGDVQAVTVIGGDIYIGGHFDNWCFDDQQNGSGDCQTPGQQLRERVAAFDGNGVLRSWNPSMDSLEGVWAFDAYRKGPLLVGGDFTTTNGKQTRRLAVFR